MSRGSGAATDLSRMARTLEVSPTVAMAQRAAARRASGKDVLDFSVGEPDQGTPGNVVAAAKRALDAGRTKYAPAAGLPELRTAVATRYRTDFGSTYATEEVAITVGGKQALYLICRALLGPGDEMVIPNPHWPTFSEAVRLAGAKPVLVPTKDKEGFAVTARLIAKGLTSKTKAVLINSPSNPTGAVIAPAEMPKILALAKKRKFTVVYDDTYAQLTFGDAGALRLDGLRELAPDRLVVLGTASKTYCMTGWRIGWVLGPKALVDACAAFASHSTQGPATFAQVAAAEALNGPQDVVPRMRAEYQKRRDALLPLLSSIPGVTCVRPQGAFYFFPNVSRCLSREVPSTLTLSLRLLDETGVAVVPGEGFAAPGYLRVSFARSLPELEAGGRRIANFLAGLRKK
jgi:aspartate aminotransferase